MFLVPRNERPLEGRLGREETAHARSPSIASPQERPSPRAATLLGERTWQRLSTGSRGRVACPEQPSRGQHRGLLGLLDLDPLFSYEPYCHSPFGVP